MPRKDLAREEEEFFSLCSQGKSLHGVNEVEIQFGNKVGMMRI